MKLSYQNNFTMASAKRQGHGHGAILHGDHSGAVQISDKKKISVKKSRIRVTLGPLVCV